jgi:hypothetical protein
MNAFMSSGRDEKQPLRLIANSNRIAAVDACLYLILISLSLFGAGFLVYLPLLTLPSYYRHIAASDQLHTYTKLKKNVHL